MGFLDKFRRKEADSELQQLVERTRAAKQDPEPYIDLAAAYLSKISKPSAWNEDYAKKSLKAYQNAIKTAGKHAPDQTNAIEQRFVTSAVGVARNYKNRFDADPQLHWLQTAIWMLEQVQPLVQNNASGQVHESLKDCWFQSTIWHEKQMEKDGAGVEELNAYKSAVQRTYTLYDEDDPMRNAIDYDLAMSQLLIGEQYVRQASNSAVIGRSDGMLLNVNDREHKRYAQMGIEILQEGRERLQRYPQSEDFDVLQSAANESLAAGYIILYNLTLAHIERGKAIQVLEEGVSIAPQDADLWATLAESYEQRAEEVLRSYKRRPSSGGFMDAMDWKATEVRINSLRNKALDCFQRARALAPDQY